MLRTAALTLALAMSLTHTFGQAPTPPVLEAEQILARLKAPKDHVLVVNFWATWCKPCIKEMPYLEQLRAAYAERGLKLLLVSNDLTDHIETQLVPFLQRRQLKGEVVVIKQANASEWIGRFDPSWSGAIPATLIVDREGKFVAFFEGEFPDYASLEAFVKPHVK